ncbi:transposase family protein, partial [Pseudomonas aeruginosa]
AYICLFVCLTTKAIHIELASDLSTDSFLAAFKRFISRRGPVSFMYSDNGTNFVGAKAQLDEMYKLLVSNNFISAWNDELTKYRIIWKMIPPRAPHFGGLWE